MDAGCALGEGAPMRRASPKPHRIRSRAVDGRGTRFAARPAAALVGDEQHDDVPKAPDGSWRLDRMNAAGEPLALQAVWSHTPVTGADGEIGLLSLELAIEQVELDRRLPLTEDAFVIDTFDDDADGAPNLDELRYPSSASGGRGDAEPAT